MGRETAVLAATCLAALALGAADFRVTALTPEYILVQGDTSRDEAAAFLASPREAAARKAQPDWRRKRLRNEIGEEIRKTVRAPFAEKLKALPGCVGYWPVPNGAKHMYYPDGSFVDVRDGDVMHNAFVKVAPMKAGTEVALGVAGKFRYDPAAPSPVFKVNQVGYVPKARKYLYLGAWLGPAGALPLRHLAGKELRVVDAATGKTAFAAPLALRMEDPANKEGTPFTGEETLEADITALEREGRYYAEVDGIGRSMEFAVSADAVAEAWGHHMRGLYNKRCGIEKKAPYTQWPSPACHLDVIRGVQPPSEGQYAKHVKPADGRVILDKKGKPVEFRHFNVIASSRGMCATNEHLRIPGGYHDAADYDRRPMHLQIPRSLAMDYLLKPGNFTDGQLCIPESGNGIPDILDEALWGIRHLLAAQQADGGIGTWIETTGHPGGAHGAPEHENHQYYLAIPTHGSCYSFAGTAALVARAFRAAGWEGEAKKMLAQAIRAWEWAERNPPVVAKMKGCAGGKWDEGPFIDLVYREPADWSVRDMLTAALNLSAMTGDLKYFGGVIARLDDLKREVSKASWSWSGYTFLEFALEGQPVPPALEAFKKEWIRRQVSIADSRLAELEGSYPYRTPWFGPTHGFVHTMSWGNSHPLHRAEAFVAAHVFTGERKYLDGIFLANDFHNGCNPRGETLTSGMGTVYPARFLDLQSVDSRLAEYVGGISPYHWTYGVAFEAKNLVYPDGSAAKWPIWRRWANVEQYSVAASEYTVWETISPPATVLAYALDAPRKVPERVYSRKPAKDIRDVPGYWTRP